MAILAQVNAHNEELRTHESFTLFKVELANDNKTTCSQCTVALGSEERCGVFFDASDSKRVIINKLWTY